MAEKARAAAGLRFSVVSLLLTGAALADPPAGMVFIPGGEFLRGRSHALEDENLKWWPTLMKDDRPVRSIRVDPFYLDQYEVTNRQYAEFVVGAKHRPPYNWPHGKIPEGKEQFPVVDVDGMMPWPTPNGRESGFRPKPNGSTPAAAWLRRLSIRGATGSRPSRMPALMK
jgi:formylglycine-generating enzyme required for sulfatase activity